MTSVPILYYIPLSPACRAVLLVAAEIGLDLDLRIINIQNGDHRTAEFVKINPQHTLPVLDDNGTIVIDSHVICMYLADKYSTDVHLYPKDLDARNVILTRLFFNCGHLFARLRKIVEPIACFGSTALCQEAIQYVKKSYEGLESCLKQYPYVCGHHMTIADLFCIASMSTAADFAPIDVNKFPNLLMWMERMSQLPYYKRCNGDGAKVLKETVMTKLEENRKAWV